MSNKRQYRRALVTGGAGFIGSHLCRRLLTEGMEVVVFDNFSTGKAANIAGGCDLIEADLRDEGALAESLRNVDIVFHNAARVSVRASNDQFIDDAQTNVMGTLALLRAMVGAQVKKLVLASSMAVYADSPTRTPIDENHACRPLSPYGTGKLASEHYAMQIGGMNGIDVVPLRYFNTYGPGQAFTPYVGVVTIFATQLLNGVAPTIFGDGQQARDFVSVHDIVEGNVCAMRAAVSGEAFNLGTGVATTVLEVAELLVARIDPSLELRFAAAQPGEIQNSMADIRRARQKLDYCPNRDFRIDVDEVIGAVRAGLEQQLADKEGAN